MRLNGKIAVITGAGSGIGRATATRFAAEGACLVIGDRNAERLEEVAGAIRSGGGTVVSAAGDISRKEVAESLVELAIANHGRIDVLVNNAGIMDHFQGVGELSDEIWRRVFATNVDAPMYTSRRTVPHMIQQGGGSIVNLSSMSGYSGASAGAAYTGSHERCVILQRAGEQTSIQPTHRGAR
jgi:NAD(P)-dependent dehydrogenase (short-subunit alcohol dehydrogenase family)